MRIEVLNSDQYAGFSKQQAIERHDYKMAIEASYSMVAGECGCRKKNAGNVSEQSSRKDAVHL